MFPFDDVIMLSSGDASSDFTSITAAFKIMLIANKFFNTNEGYMNT